MAGKCRKQKSEGLQRKAWSSCGVRESAGVGVGRWQLKGKCGAAVAVGGKAQGSGGGGGGGGGRKNVRGGGGEPALF